MKIKTTQTVQKQTKHSISQSTMPESEEHSRIAIAVIQQNHSTCMHWKARQNDTAWAGNEKTPRCNFSFFYRPKQCIRTMFFNRCLELNAAGDIRPTTRCKNHAGQRKAVDAYNIQPIDTTLDNGQMTGATMGRRHRPEVAVCARAMTSRIDEHRL